MIELLSISARLADCLHYLRGVKYFHVDNDVNNKDLNMALELGEKAHSDLLVFCDRSDFVFRSRFSQEIHQIFINLNMTLKDVADKLNWQPAYLSSYYADKRFLSDNDALALSNLLQDFGYNYSPKSLQQLQREAVCIDLTKKRFYQSSAKNGVG